MAHRTFKQELFVSLLILALGVLAVYRVRGLEQQDVRNTRTISTYRTLHQRTCSLLRTRFQSAALEAKRGHEAPGFNYLLVSDTFREVIVFSDICVTMPPAAQAAAEAISFGLPDPDVVVRGVLALDAAFNAAAAAEWPR